MPHGPQNPCSETVSNCGLHGLYLSAMASSESPVPPQVSTSGGIPSINQSDSPCAEDIGRPQISRLSSIRTSSDRKASSPQRSRRRPSPIADDDLPVGLLENAIGIDQLLNDDFDFHNFNRRSSSCRTATRNQMAVEKVQRWSGMTRTVGDWDGLRRVSTTPNSRTLY